MKTTDDKVLTIVGLKYAQASADFGEKVTLAREPANKYDSNALKVVNASNRTIGHIKKDDAAPISAAMDKFNAVKGQTMIAEGEIISAGDGYQQSVQITLKKIVAKTREWDPEQTRKNEAMNPYSAKKKKAINQNAEGKALATTAATASLKKKEGGAEEQLI